MAPLKKKKRSNLAEILDDLEGDAGDIYILPPQNVTETTDDESGDDENVHSLSHKILTLPAELKGSRKEIIPEKQPLKKIIINRVRCQRPTVKNNDKFREDVLVKPVKIKKDIKRKTSEPCDILDKNSDNPRNSKDKNNNKTRQNRLVKSVKTPKNIAGNGNQLRDYLPPKDCEFLPPKDCDNLPRKDCDNLPPKDCDNSQESSREENNDTILLEPVKSKKSVKRQAKDKNCDHSSKKRKIVKQKTRKTNCKAKLSSRSKTFAIKNINNDKKCSKPQKGKNNDIEWTIGGETDVNQTEFGFTVTSTDSKSMDTTDYFELFFDDPILELIIYESSQYCLSKNWPDINLTKGELRTFFAILIISGYNPLPSKAMHWNRGKDLRNDAIYESMRRDRFDNIMKSLHFASEENLDKSDKYSKLRPIISHLQKKFMQQFSPTEAISHDEAMVEYFGNHGCKQSIRDKPIRFGYKVFCHNTPSGYLVAFDPYQGKTYQGDEEMEKQFGKSASSLLNILDKYPVSKSEYPYHFYCDNYFTSLPLCKELKNRGYNCTGTIRANRLGKSCPLTDVKKFSNKNRGYTEVATANISGDNVFFSRWKDNNVVTVASTRFATNPEGSVKRWCKTEKKHIQVPIPHSIYNYNRNMGGTDRTDQNVNAYRISIRGKKWWWCLFTWMLDVSVQNAWLLARKENPKLVQLQFRRDLAMSYLSAHNQPPKAAGRKRKMSISGNQTMRLDKIAHFVRNTGNNKQRRCRGNNCKSKVRTECSKCNVGLCVPCFETYHIVA